MEGEQNFAIGVSVSDSHAAAQISGWDMHPTFLSDAELLELGFEDMSHAYNTIQQAHHKKEDAQFGDINGVRAVGASNLPKLCWPQGEQAPAQPEQQQQLQEPNYTETVSAAAAAATATTGAGATLGATTPPTDEHLVGNDKIREACATACAMHGAIAEGAVFDMVKDKDGLTEVLKSTVIVDAKAPEATTTTKNNNKRSHQTKSNKAAEKRAKHAGGARGKALPSCDNHSSGSATSKPAPGGEESDKNELANIHNLNFVNEVKALDNGDGKPRSSQFRGVTKHKRSGRWEAHIWVKETGKQMYLGGYEKEEHAAEAYDVAAMKCKGGKAGRKVKLNFPADKYAELVTFMESVSLEELVMAIRRQSQGFARGSSGFRGVTHHPNGRWEARIGMPGSKHIYLGLYNEESAAARAYDRALVRLRGPSAATNYALANYKTELQAFETDKSTEKLHATNTAAAAKALKDKAQACLLVKAEEEVGGGKK